jgi:flagellar biosynthesis protein FlhF
MNAELRSLRELLERQLATLAWNDFTRRDPVRARALTDLTNLGMPRDDAWALLQNIPADALEVAGSQAHHDALAAALRTVDMEPLLQGAVALVGPPGAGKSTLLAKLAVRAVVEYGAAQVAIVTLDTQRLGAGDQARAIGRLLGIDTVAVDNDQELQQQRARWSGRRLVLIDTAGVSPRDAAALQSLQQQFINMPELRTLLVLPASAQPELLQCCLERFAALRPVAAVLTRIDEALSLGGALAALLRHTLPLAALCDGPRVPEDLQPARGAALVERALAMHSDMYSNGGAQHAAA